MREISVTDSFSDISNYGVMQEQVIKEVNGPSNGTRISYSQFSQWVQCPHKWKLQYIDGYGQFKGNIYTIFGSVIHECIQLYLRVMYVESIKEMQNELPLDEFLMDEMKKQYLETKESLEEGEVLSSAEELKEFYFQGVQILDYFKKKKGSIFQ